MTSLYTEVISQIATLPEENLSELIEFIKSLKQKASSTLATKKPCRRAGISKDPNFFMAKDFDAPLEDFKEYM